jgi:hypothetical protein
MSDFFLNYRIESKLNILWMDAPWVNLSNSVFVIAVATEIQRTGFFILWQSLFSERMRSLLWPCCLALGPEHRNKG